MESGILDLMFQPISEYVKVFVASLKLAKRVSGA